MQSYFKDCDLDKVGIIASKLAEKVSIGDVILLKGDLGSGKTTFARYFIKSISDGVGEVPSPTFTLVQIFDTRIGKLYHFDLYRLNHESEIYEIGIEDALDNSVVLMEWPELVENILPKQRITIELSIVSDTLRSIKISGVDIKL